MPEPRKTQPRKTAAKKTAARKTTAKAEPVVLEDPAVDAELLREKLMAEEPEDHVAAHTSDLAVDWLMRRAFPHGQWPHAAVVIEGAGLPPEVEAALLSAYARNNV